MGLWGIIRIASLVVMVIVVAFIWHADGKLVRLQQKADEKSKK